MKWISSKAVPPLVPGFELEGLNSLYHDITVARSNGRYSVSLKDQVVARRMPLGIERVRSPKLPRAAGQTAVDVQLSLA